MVDNGVTYLALEINATTFQVEKKSKEEELLRRIFTKLSYH